MNQHDVYDQWLSSIDLSKTRIIKTPSLIFLCGGPVSENSGCFKSCRDIFYHHLKNCSCSYKDRIILAERTFDYFNHSEYKDLLTFETDLAELSSLIIIFSESPGSIAEFGSFSVLEKTKDRLLVVIHGDHSEVDSFIWRGPAAHLMKLAEKNGTPNPIIVYRWKKDIPAGGHLEYGDFEDASDLEEAVESIVSNFPNTEKFDQKRLGHVMLLMLECLRVARIATADDVEGFLVKLGISYDKSDVKRFLSLISSLGYSMKKQYRNNLFYHPTNDNVWVSWAYKKGSKINDTVRWTNILTENYSINEPQKQKALRSHIKSIRV